jgi:hypothetical protein
VLAFISLIAPHITTNVRICFTNKLSHLDENQLASLNQLLQIIRDKMTTIRRINFSNCLSNIQFVPYVDNKMNSIGFCGVEESDIPILMQFLASPRPDGEQQVIKIYFRGENQFLVTQKLLDAIIEVLKSL